MGLVSLIAASGALLGALITTVLLRLAARNTAANHQLALVAGLASVYQLATVAHHLPDHSLLSPLRGGAIAIFLLGPSLYLYTRARINADDGWRLPQLWHLLPVGLVTADVLVAQLLTGQPLADRFPHLLGVLCYALLVAYLCRALYLSAWAPDRQAEPPALRWLHTLLGTCLALTLLGLVFALVRWLWDGFLWPQQIWSMTVVMGMSYLIVAFALLEPSVFHGGRKKHPGKAAGQARYETSSLTGQQARELWVRLESLMAAERPYLQSQLKLGELASRLGVPASHLSQTINQVAGCSYAVYLNRYRITCAQELLRETAPGQRTMLDIALSVGFNSQSVFYKHFRDLVGLSPRAYQNLPH